MGDAPTRGTARVRAICWIDFSKKKQTTQTRDRGGGQGPHLHEQDFGRTIRGTGGSLLLLTRDTTQARSAVHGGLPHPLAVSSQSSDLPPASRWQSLATTGTLTATGVVAGAAAAESPTYYAGLPH